MADTAPATISDIRTLITDVTPVMIREVIQETVPTMIRDAIQQTVPGMVREIIKETVPEIVQDIVEPIFTKLDRYDKHFVSLERKVYELGVLVEDLDDRFMADSELLRSNFEVKDQVQNHENRLARVENTQSILYDAVREHSRRLRPKLS